MIGGFNLRMTTLTIGEAGVIEGGGQPGAGAVAGGALAAVMVGGFNLRMATLTIGEAGVIKRGRCPSGGGVATVTRARVMLKRLYRAMTICAQFGGALIETTRMAIGAGQSRMPTREREKIVRAGRGIGRKRHRVSGDDDGRCGRRRFG